MPTLINRASLPLAEMLLVERTLTSDEMATAYSSPVPILEAPGSGFAYQVYQTFFQFVPGLVKPRSDTSFSPSIFWDDGNPPLGGYSGDEFEKNVADDGDCRFVFSHAEDYINGISAGTMIEGRRYKITTVENTALVFSYLDEEDLEFRTPLGEVQANGNGNDYAIGDRGTIEPPGAGTHATYEVIGVYPADAGGSVQAVKIIEGGDGFESSGFLIDNWSTTVTTGAGNGGLTVIPLRLATPDSLMYVKVFYRVIAIH
jgi:hypothetical protein